MSQKELVLYLENLKNLEILKHNAVLQLNMYDNRIAEESKKIKEKGYCFDTSTIVSLIVSVVLICGAIGVRYYSSVYSQGSYNGFVLFCLKYILPYFLTILAIVIPSVCGAFSDFFQTIRWKIEAKKHNKHVKQIKAQVIKEIEKIGNRKEEIRVDIMEINKLLEEAYSFNLIPLQFRELPYIIYIYDYVSTSQQTLENALLHSHIEKAVKQITAKLDVIIAQNMQVISLLKYNLLATYANTAQMITLTNDVKLNNHLVRVNNFYMQSKLL